MLPFIFVIVCTLFEWKRLCAGFFLSFVYICISTGDPGDPIIKMGRVRIFYNTVQIKPKY
jgi:hypothetical protein